MFNNLELLLSESRHSNSEVMNVVDRLNLCHAKAAELCVSLDRLGTPMNRRAMTCAILGSVAGGIDPDLSYVSAQTGIARATLNRWFDERAGENALRYEWAGRRKVVVIDRPVRPELMELLDWHVDFRKQIAAAS